MNVFQTQEEATQYAIEQFGALQVETECVNVIRIGPLIARYYGCEVGYAVDKEMER